MEENEDVIFHVEEINGKNSALKVQPVNENFVETKNGNLETNFNKNKKRRRKKKYRKF